MEFKLYSESNKKVIEELKPDFGFRSWDLLTKEDKEKIWFYFEFYFFDKDIRRDFNNPDSDSQGYYYHFFGNYNQVKNKHARILKSISDINELYKAKSYASNYLEKGGRNNACKDFYLIFCTESENVVMELLSLYCKATIWFGNETSIYKKTSETKEGFDQRLLEWNLLPFHDFAKKINDVFSHFGLNLYLTEQGFIPRQESKITEDIFEPVLKSLSNPKWKEVNQLLADSFMEYAKNTPSGFSNSVTNSVSSVQAFLQIINNGETGKGDISKLISQAQKNLLIPNDSFTEKIFSDIESILMRERQETSTAHPKKEYATEKNARLVLNLTMIFFQHCLQN